MHVHQLFNLKGRVAVVTGGSVGLGYQMAEALAEMGAHVVVCARKLERCLKAAETLKQHGVRTLALRCDVTDPAQVRELVERTLAEFGTIDILVNNAGISWGAPPEKMRLQDWEKVLRTNLTGAFLCTQAVGQVMIGRRRGKIIQMASIAGLGGIPAEIMEATGYHASKGGLIAMTKDLACKWARHQVQVNAIAPGWFPTHMSNWVIEHRGETILQRIPQARFGGQDDLKGAVVFLASDASAYITGHVLAVDGGYSAW
jgi:gluconate 5-dehydrogenase